MRNDNGIKKERESNVHPTPIAKLTQPAESIDEQQSTNESQQEETSGKKLLTVPDAQENLRYTGAIKKTSVYKRKSPRIASLERSNNSAATNDDDDETTSNKKVKVLQKENYSICFSFI